MDKKLFICHAFNNTDQYAVLADNAEEAKKIVADFLNKHYESRPPYLVPYTIDDIGVIDVESVKQSMIAENTSLEVL